MELSIGIYDTVSDWYAIGRGLLTTVGTRWVALLAVGMSEPTNAVPICRLLYCVMLHRDGGGVCSWLMGNVNYRCGL